MKASIKSLKENLLYQKGYHDGFIEGQNEGLKLAEKIIKNSSVGKSLIIPEGYVLVLSDKPEKTDFESNPDGKPMRVTMDEKKEA
ncbi:unnamed protein product [marine sediment metagenome]|uniref:Uncharacterized protein n=1 Tax=marine sediment metagenome TaxID=412755 RepID=X1AQ77_9ZZZZ